MTQRMLKISITSIFIFICYAVSGILAVRLLTLGGIGTPVWPPTGIALACLLIFGWRYWPLIGLGSLAVDLGTDGSWISGLFTSIGNILEVSLAYYLLVRVARFKNSFDSLRQVLALILFGALLCPLVSASFGVISLRLIGHISAGDALFHWVVWWLANGAGVLLILPLILVWKEIPPITRLSRRVFEALFVLFLVALMSFVIFGPLLGPIYHRPAAYFIFPFFLWISIRFGQPLSVIGAVLVGVFGVWGTSMGFGPFAVGDWVESIFHLQSFLIMLSVTGMVFSAVVAERKLDREDLHRHLQIEKALRESEEKFRTFNLYLEKRVAERTRELERINKELEEFAYVASHDLQEPLRAVTSFGILLEEEFASTLPQRAREYLRFVVGGARRMQSLIGDLLNYSRLGGERAPIFSIENFSDIVEEAKTNLMESVRESGATIVCKGLPSLRVERDRIVQVFQNLIGNAIKFRGDRKPDIRVTGILKGSVWEICVSDNGIGIGKEYKDRIFQIFQRLHTRTEYPGSGIGLSICKKIIERLQGEIWVESELGVGSKFYFTIPVGEYTP